MTCGSPKPFIWPLWFPEALYFPYPPSAAPASTPAASSQRNVDPGLTKLIISAYTDHALLKGIKLRGQGGLENPPVLKVSLLTSAST